jgi:hypothetical protein
MRTDAVVGLGPSCAEAAHSGTTRTSGRAQLAAMWGTAAAVGKKASADEMTAPSGSALQGCQAVAYMPPGSEPLWIASAVLVDSATAG